MKTIEKTVDNKSFEWIDKNDLRSSRAERIEIYVNDEDSIIGLRNLFYNLFGNLRSKLIIQNLGGWWNFCLDTLSFDSDEGNYDMEDKAEESKAYLQLLIDSHIEIGYNGFCKCNDWDQFLHIILYCVVNGTAPYSPLLCEEENQLFFYFHHTGSIGLYFKESNEVIKTILQKANALGYELRG